MSWGSASQCVDARDRSLTVLRAHPALASARGGLRAILARRLRGPAHRLKPRGPRCALTPIHHAGLAPRAIHGLDALAEYRLARFVQLAEQVAEALGIGVALVADLDEPIEQLGRVPGLIEVQLVTGHVDHATGRIEPHATAVALFAGIGEPRGQHPVQLRYREACFQVL